MNGPGGHPVPAEGAAWRDRIAQRAAAHLFHRREREMEPAVARAARELAAPAWVPRPSAALVRRHAQAMAEEALGGAWYRVAAAARLWHARRAMEALEAALAAPTLLVGRAARGHTDADATLHVRVYTREPVARIAQALVDAGLPEPELRTVETRHGRANQMRFVLPDALLVVQRCLPEWWRERGSDLVTGRATATRTLTDLLRETDGDPGTPGRPGA